MNVGNIKLSVFPEGNDMQHGKVMCLTEIVSILVGGGGHDRVEYLRDINNGTALESRGMPYKERHDLYKHKRLRGLPIFYPCGIVERTKPIKVVEPSNLICMDIDRKDNLFANFPWLIAMCKKSRSNPEGWGMVSAETARLFNSVCLVCESVSGTGVFMLMHFQGDRGRAFDYAVATLAKIGINADLGAKAPTQCRYFSYDPKLYYNPDPVTLEVPDAWRRPATASATIATAPPPAEIGEVPPQEIPKFKASTKTVQRQLENALRYVVAHNTDITATIADWKTLKTSIYCAQYAKVIDNGFGIFWTFSKFYPGADESENKDFFSQPLDRVRINPYKPATLNGLWSLCRKYGVPYE